MSLNWREIDVVLEELELVGSHIQEVVQTDFRNICFRIYRPRRAFWLRVCLETGKTRLHATQSSIRKPQKRQRFSQLLHSRVKGGRITDARQIDSERIVRIEVVTAGLSSVLWIRLWGGAANIILTEPDKTIIDAFFRRPKRGEVSGGLFTLPEKADSRRSNQKTFEPRFSIGGENSASEQIAGHYQNLTDSEQRERLLSSVRKALVVRRDRLGARLESAKKRLQGASGAEALQLSADLIMANLSTMEKSSRWLEAEDYTRNNAPVTIELEEDLSPVENAERYYSMAKKARKRSGALEEEASNLSHRLRLVESQLEELDEKSLDELAEINRELTPPAKAKRPSDEQLPGLVFVSGRFTILVGRNSRENDLLLRHHTRGNDLWLHTRDYPGGYVFVKTRKNKSVPLDVLLDAGNLAVHFSKARANGKAELYYTEVKYLRRAKNGPAGLVLPTQEKNLSITVEDERLSRLMA